MTLYRWNGSAWEQISLLKIWNGSAWAALVSIHEYNGGWS